MARFLVVCLVVLSLLAPRTVLAQTPAVPRFEPSSCPFLVNPSLIEGKDISCGWLIVPENRLVANGKTIKLAVAVLKSASSHPASDPVFFLNGGPGGDTLSNIESFTSSSRDFWARDRDVVFMDQRGTGYSQPALRCPGIKKLDIRALANHYSFQKEGTLETGAVSACRTALLGRGIDLSGYTSIQDAADIADLRTVLGYPEINLYGVSYGTRLALTVMRYYPQGIRSVVLDSVYGPGVNLFKDLNRGAARDFNLVLDSCAGASGCHKLYPHLRSDLYSLVKRLDKKPVKITVLDAASNEFKASVSGEVLVESLFSALYDQRAVPQIPQWIVAAAKGGASGPGAIALQQLVQYISPYRDDSVSLGMYLSVECSEDFPGITQADVDASSLALPGPLRKDFTAGTIRTFHDCQTWNVPAVPLAQKGPVMSDIPTIVMEGEFDPITPPEYGATVAGTLSKSFSFVYPGLGHGTTFEHMCPNTMMWQFLDDPTRRPDNSCIATMSEPFVVRGSTTAARPVGAVTIRGTQLRTAPWG
jgi:pimeloyl-ACP methyl ester carboxylesterase